MCSLHRRDAGLGGRSANGDAIAQAHGYGGLNLRTLAEQVGIKAGSLYHHFPSKADLAAAVARRYAEDSAATLDALAAGAGSAALALRGYPDTFRRSLENNNRMCLCSFMAAEYDDLPAAGCRADRNPGLCRRQCRVAEPDVAGRWRR